MSTDTTTTSVTKQRTAPSHPQMSMISMQAAPTRYIHALPTESRSSLPMSNKQAFSLSNACHRDPLQKWRQFPTHAVACSRDLARTRTHPNITILHRHILTSIPIRLASQLSARSRLVLALEYLIRRPESFLTAAIAAGTASRASPLHRFGQT